MRGHLKGCIVKADQFLNKRFDGKTILIAVMFVVIVALGVLYVRSWLMRDRTVISDDSIREEIIPVAKVTTYEYNFTQVLFLSDAGNPININNPITSKRYVATVDGSIPIQTDAEEIECKGTTSPTGELVSVRVTMPHSSIGDVSLDPDSLTKYVEDNGFLNLNQVSTDDLNALMSQAKKDQIAKLEDSDVLEKADERMETIITAQLQSIHEGVTVSFEYIDEE